MKKNTIIKVNEKYGDNCLTDRVGAPKIGNKPRKPEGFVEIYESVNGGEKKLLGKHNLVVYQGREWIAQRVVDTRNAAVTPTQNEFICWFGVGSGGTLVASPLNPLTTASTDAELTNPVPIHVNDDDVSIVYTNRQDGIPGDYYKKEFDNITFNQDSDNDNKWLITKITMIIDNDDCNDTDVVGLYTNNHLNEAGLYTCNTSQGGSAQVGPWNIYARVTFPTIVKDTNRQLTIIWYLYF